MGSPPTPGGELPRFQLWSSKIDNNGREVGVKNPEACCYERRKRSIALSEINDGEDDFRAN